SQYFFTVPRERSASCQEMIEDGSQSIDVRALVDVLTAGLLGRHVRRRSEDRARRGSVIGSDPIRTRSYIGRLGLVGQVLREAPIDHHGLAKFADHEVARLEVAMNDAMTVCICDGISDGRYVREQRQSFVESGLFSDEFAERAS